jgi:hypothetical protein
MRPYCQKRDNNRCKNAMDETEHRGDNPQAVRVHREGWSLIALAHVVLFRNGLNRVTGKTSVTRLARQPLLMLTITPLYLDTSICPEIFWRLVLRALPNRPRPEGFASVKWVRF